MANRYPVLVASRAAMSFGLFSDFTSVQLFDRIVIASPMMAAGRSGAATTLVSVAL